MKTAIEQACEALERMLEFDYGCRESQDAQMAQFENCRPVIEAARAALKRAREEQEQARGRSAPQTDAATKRATECPSPASPGTGGKAREPGPHLSPSPSPPPEPAHAELVEELARVTKDLATARDHLSRNGGRIHGQTKALRTLDLQVECMKGNLRERQEALDEADIRAGAYRRDIQKKDRKLAAQAEELTKLQALTSSASAHDAPVDALEAFKAARTSAELHDALTLAEAALKSEEI